MKLPVPSIQTPGNRRVARNRPSMVIKVRIMMPCIRHYDIKIPRIGKVFRSWPLVLAACLGEGLFESTESVNSIAGIDFALTRLANGQYGVSELSGEPIPYERLYRNE